ncbi:MAG: glycosyltransferase family 4 protein [Chlorobiaceae bacterium]|nr:glycosyltransferase family 4 protein [Chlorobiaceae bacterium]NTW10270.1 glycosyltransferase family 4 protein [Chlorobiaceae bacterium]
MNICLVFDLRLPTKKYGGTERVIEWLVLEYLKKGHSITIVAPSGTAVEGVQCIPADSHEQALKAIPRNSDIVHFHAWPPVNDFELPWLFTLHGNATDISTLPKNTVFISANHAARHHSKLFVYNGINPDEFVFNERKKDYLLFIALIRRRVKGAERAIHLARRYRFPVLFAGGSRIDLLKAGGLLSSFHPLLTFVGKVAGQEKARYFSDAKALLFPIFWEEPFGLVLIESLMSGTPVIATPRGSVPELIPAEVGALFTDDDMFPEALEKAQSCSPHLCREWAMTYFTSSICATNYLKLYERILSGESVF